MDPECGFDKVTFERFREIMGEVDAMIGRNSYFSQEMLALYTVGMIWMGWIPIWVVFYRVAIHGMVFHGMVFGGMVGFGRKGQFIYQIISA